MWRRAALCAVILASGIATADDAASPHCAGAATPSKIDYMVLASMADSPHLLSMAGFQSTIGRAASLRRADTPRLEVPSTRVYSQED
jgi:hypothetical protein